MVTRILFFALIMILLMNANIALAEGYNISKVLNPPEEYLVAKNKIEEEGLFYSQDNWRLAFSKNRYIESQVTGKKKDREGNLFKTMSLYAVIDGNKYLIDEGYYDYGRVVWNASGTHFIYQAIEDPPVDFPIGDVIIVKIDEHNKVEKKEIVKGISYSHFRWAEKTDKVAFADFEAVYLYNCDNGELQIIIGDWDENFEYKKGIGYPRLCDSFVWLNNDTELYFTYYANLFIFDYEQYYKITF